MSEIMEIIEKTERQKSKDRKTQRSGASYSESVRAKSFCCAFKLAFVQLICKASLIIKSKLGSVEFLSQRMLWWIVDI